MLPCGPGYYACGEGDCCCIGGTPGCGGGTPTPVPGDDDDGDDDVDPPSCNLTLSGLTSLTKNQSDLVTATITSAVGTSIDQIQFSVSDPTVAEVSPTYDNVFPFVTNLLPNEDGTTTVNATVIGGNKTVCSDSYTLTVNSPTPSVTGHIYASNDLVCGGTTPAVGYTGGTMVMSNTDGLSGYISETKKGVNSSTTFTIPGNTSTGYQYTLGFANDDTNWIMRCPLPASHTLTVKDQPIERSFYVTQVADPWWQVAGGDVAAPGNIVQKIPGAATQPYGSYATASLDSGAFIAGNTIDTNNYSVGSTTNWKVQDSPYHVSVKEGYSYFMRIAEMGVSPQDDFTAGEAVTLTHDDLTKDPANLTVDDRKGLYHRGDVTLGDSATPIVIAANEKVILFVNGNVTVDGNITVANGGYLAVITNGNITFSENSYTAHGQYVADGFLIVRDAAAGDGAARQFVGEGNFVGWRGVTLERSLEPATDPLANNQNPAELFIYRPDLLFNTPLTLKYGSIEWREVAPRQLE